MEFLIIGALFLIALLALVASLFVIRNGATARNEHEERAAGRNTAAPALRAPLKDEKETGQRPTYGATPAPPAKSEEQVSREDEPISPADGQVQELAVELRYLQEQAQVLSERLGALTEKASAIEHARDKDVEDESGSQGDRQGRPY
jgi:hypothetical protein